MPKEKPAASKQSHAPNPSAEPAVSSAPELPKELAKQLGGDAQKSKKSSSNPSKNPADADQAADAADASASEDSLAHESELIDNQPTDQAVDQIVAKESDDILAAADAAAAGAPNMAVRRGFWRRLAGGWSAWWHNPWARWATFIVVVAVAGVVTAVPSARYRALNVLGVRCSTSLVVLDGTTQLPLRNVTVAVAGQHTQTNVNGAVKLTNLKLGPQQLTIQRVAFAPITQNVTLGWGSNPLGAFSLHAVGRQYIIQVKDFVSGKPVLAAEATHDDISALSDKTGKITLTMEDTNLNDITVTVTANDYRSETFTLKADSSAVSSIAMVPSRKEVFVSKQSGKLDLMAMDLDGQNKKLLLGGTGLENNNVALAVSGDGSEVALVSTRDNMRDSDGFLLSALTLVNVDDGAVLTLDHAEQLQLVGWLDNRIVYQTASAGVSAANPQRYRLMSYDYKTNNRLQLAAANQFNVVMAAQGTIYYASSSTDPKAQLGLFKIKATGAGRQRVLTPEVWSGFRTGYDGLLLQTPDGWYSYVLSTGASSKIGAPASYANRQYIDNSTAGQSVWIDTRDGKGALLLYDTGTAKDTTLQTQDGLTYPLRWLNDRTLIYRIATAQETADYAASSDGGAPKKLTDVTNAYGFAQGF